MDSTDDVIWLGPDAVLRLPPPGSAWRSLGWAAYFSDSTRGLAEVLLRFGRHSQVRFADFPPGAKAPLVVHETVIRVGFDGGTATAAAARDIPFARLEAAVNLRLLRRGELPAEEEFPFVTGQAPPHDRGSEEWREFPEGPHRRPRGPSLKLRVPPAGSRPDRFYEQVAERYLWLASQGPRPAEELARANDVAPATVHLWVREARRRDILPPGQRAKRAPTKGDE